MTDTRTNARGHNTRSRNPNVDTKLRIIRDINEYARIIDNSDEMDLQQAHFQEFTRLNIDVPDVINMQKGQKVTNTTM